MIECTNCSKLTTNPKFCNKSCSAIWTNKNYNKRRGKGKLRICKKCNIEYRSSRLHQSRILCKECSLNYRTIKSKQTTLKEVRESDAIKGKHPSWLHSRVRANNKNWNKHLAKLPCQFCNYKLHVELCHIKSIASFPDSATLGEVNHPDNILVLCRNHHWEFDNKYLVYENGKFKINIPEKRKSSKYSLCKDCNIKITKGALRCRKCVPRKTKILWPKLNELIEMIRVSNCSAVSRKLGVSDNAIRKHIARYLKD